MMEKLKNMKSGPSPHIRTPRTTPWVMTQVLIALIPPAAAATYFFGWKVLLLIALGMLTSVASEYLFQKLTYRKITINDRSALVTGALLGLSLPVTAPWWTVVIGSVFAIVIVKQLPGGIGKNTFNPAVAARVMLKAFFSPWITNWVLPGPDAMSSATPLEYIGGGVKIVSEKVPDLFDLFMGFNLGGNAGETSKLLILVGMIYLIVRRIINPKIPILYILTAMLVTGFYSGFNLEFMASHAFSGTLFFAATYMATDYSSGALTPEGKTVFAIGAGVLTAFFRIAFTYPGGVGFAILIMNALAPHIDQKLMPRIYGHKRRPDVKFNRQKRA
ncbi:RnfABCDGE type electron transport complex subunit D [Proteiniclasticum sp. SCR006]|uniref:Ion-translocating oxidoreductase complex subunit D n=1 Tax=Proteiniclasticum aestuarii TaxID=2817862 RepID=A0A939HB43_9CLOT|nr:RnfABCDGE type electron transport complex subunit D [Proteiniclasticum aestuarii]MBO1265203.1 RnfABCDGE type electron transport complex subunit D [Proteiniclasticum aestuarii]